MVIKLVLQQEVIKQVEEGVQRFQRSVPPKIESEPSQAFPHTTVAVTASNRVHMDSLGSGSSATLESNRTQDDDERYHLPTPLQGTVQNPGKGSQGVPVTNDGITIDPNQLVQETFQHAKQLQAEEAERIRPQGKPYTQVAMDLRENEP